MLSKEQVIECVDYRKICEYSYDGTNLDDEFPDNSVVWIAPEHVYEWHQRHNNDDKKYILVSSRSDYGISYQEFEPPWQDILKSLWIVRYCSPPDVNEIGYKGLELGPRFREGYCNIKDKYSVKCWAYTRSTIPNIPANIKTWFWTNNCIEEPNIVTLPFGVQEDRRELIYKWMNTDVKRDKLLYNNMQCSNEGRMFTNIYFKAKQLPYVTHVNEPKSYEEYLYDLKSHKYCIVSPGNGADTQRMLESLYMGCVPVTPYTIVTRWFTYFPLVYIKYEDWMRIFCNFEPFDFESFLNLNIEFNPHDIPQLSLDYWKEQIYAAKNI